MCQYVACPEPLHGTANRRRQVKIRGCIKNLEEQHKLLAEIKVINLQLSLAMASCSGQPRPVASGGARGAMAPPGPSPGPPWPQPWPPLAPALAPPGPSPGPPGPTVGPRDLIPGPGPPGRRDDGKIEKFYGISHEIRRKSTNPTPPPRI